MENDFSIFKGGFRYLDSVCIIIWVLSALFHRNYARQEKTLFMYCWKCPLSNDTLASTPCAFIREFTLCLQQVRTTPAVHQRIYYEWPKFRYFFWEHALSNLTFLGTSYHLKLLIKKVGKNPRNMDNRSLLDPKFNISGCQEHQYITKHN